MRNKHFVIKTFKDGDFSIDIRFDIEKDTIWMTQKEIASVFETSPSSINHRLEDIETDDKNLKTCIDWESIVLPDGRKYNTKIYNLEIITLLSYKVRSKRAPTFISWVKETIQELKQNQLIEINDSYNNLLHSNKYEVVKFQDDDFEMNVNVSPEEETVWLNEQQMAELFEEKRNTINFHITNILSQQELDFSVCRKIRQTASDGKRYYVNFYNLDMVLAIGYRVNTDRGIKFRRWCNKVLKQYLLNGYAINEKMILNKNNFINLVNKVLELEKEFSIFKKEFEKPLYNIFYRGEFFDSYSFILKIILEAMRSITIIDSYLDLSILQYIKKVDKNIDWTLISSSKCKITSKDLKIFERQYFKINFYINDDYHDRFIILDNKTIYHIGTSLNYLGNRNFVVSKIDDEQWCKDFINKLNI